MNEMIMDGHDTGAGQKKLDRQEACLAPKRM